MYRSTVSWIQYIGLHFASQAKSPNELQAWKAVYIKQAHDEHAGIINYLQKYN